MRISRQSGRRSVNHKTDGQKMSAGRAIMGTTRPETDIEPAGFFS
jgi:hypothetical protein